LFKAGNIYIDKREIMKKIAIMGSLAVAMLLVLNFSGSAQVERQYAAHVPFDFTVGNKVMKAGDYTLGPASGITNQRSLILWDRSNGRGIVVGQASIGPEQSEEEGKLTFIKNGDDWALGAIDTPRFALKLKKIRTDRGELQLAKKQVVTLQN